VANQRRAEKLHRLLQLYSAQDLTGLPAMERAVQEQEMLGVYMAFDDEWLETAIATAESLRRYRLESLAKDRRHQYRLMPRISSCKRTRALATRRAQMTTKAGL
jgi:hypothetical protein